MHRIYGAVLNCFVDKKMVLATVIQDAVQSLLAKVTYLLLSLVTTLGIRKKSNLFVGSEAELSLS